MKRSMVLACAVLVVVALVVLLAPLAAQEPDPTTAPAAVDDLCPCPAEVAPEGEPVQPGGWVYGPASPFQYQRFDAVFVPGPAGEPWANKVYFMGGRISAPAELPDIWVFDPVTGIYTDTQADMIEDVSNYDADLILDDGTGRGPAVYVVGGYDKDGGSGGGGLGLVQRYYPQSNLIEGLPAIDNWPGQVAGYTLAGMGTAVVDDVIYVFGGWESNVSPYFDDDTWAFDPSQPSGSRWTNLGIPLSQGRSYIQSAAQGGKIYAMGGIYGYVGGDLVPTDRVEVLDTANLAAGWTVLSPLPLPLAEGRGFGFDDDTLGLDAPWDGLLFTAGGGDWPDISREAMKYTIASDSWDQGFPDLNDRRVNNAGAFIPLCTPEAGDGLPGLWVWGGRSENGCDPPYGATEFYDLPCADCIGLTGAIITGPLQLPPFETGVYSVTLQPPDATEPVDVLWSNGMTGTSVAYSWSEPGFYTVVVTGSNCAGLSVVTASLEVEVPCVELITATIAGPAELLAGEGGVFSVTLEPPDATEPIGVVWSNGASGYTATYSWAAAGDYTVTVTATNCTDVMVVDQAGVTVHPAPPALQRIYLPLVVRNH